MNEPMTEEEQLEAFKRWWKENGKWLITALVLGVGGYFGWTSYEDQQEAKIAAGSDLYTELVETLEVQESSSLNDSDRDRVVELVEQLKADHAGSAYGIQAALLKARLAVEEGELDSAQSELDWALAQGPDAALEPIIRLRLARVQTERGEHDAALATIDAATPGGALQSDYAETRGDILSARGETRAAVEAYESALESLDAQDRRRQRLLQMKLDDLQPAAAESGTADEENAS